ncbi:MAG TPA: DoxX family protein [bacterium]|nr:DoxX family protein [bacterium]
MPRAARIDLFLIRLAPAAVFLVHGYLKLFGGDHDRTVALFLTVNIPFAEQAAWFVGGLELAGGLALLTGVLIRPLALLLAIEMAAAITMVRMRQTFVGAGEFEFTLLLVCLGIALRPRGVD